MKKFTNRTKLSCDDLVINNSYKFTRNGEKCGILQQANTSGDGKFLSFLLKNGDLYSYSADRREIIFTMVNNCENIAPMTSDKNKLITPFNSIKNDKLGGRKSRSKRRPKRHTKRRQRKSKHRLR